MPAGPGSGAKIGEAYVEVGANQSALQAGMASARQTFDKQAAAIETRAKKMASTLKTAWKTAAAGTAILAAGVGKAVDMYMDFEDQQVELQKKLGASREAIQGITDDLTNLSMELPTTRQELTEIAAEAAKVGISQENIVAYTKVMKMFEEATGMAADQAALFFGRINAIAQAPISTVENLGSALAYLLDNFPVAEAEKITQVMLKMGRSVISSMEASQAELAGLATAISSISKRASRPANQLRQAFMGMAEDTEEYARIVKMETEELADSINDNAIQAFEDWLKRFKSLYGTSGMTVERIRALAGISESAAKGILPFVANIDLLSDAIDDSIEQFDKNEALALKYEIALTRLSTQLKITRGNISTSAQALGGVFAPTVREVNEQYLQPFTERLVYIMTQSEETRDAIRSMVLQLLKVGGAITAIGLVIKALTMMVSPVFQIMALAGLLWAAWEVNLWNIRDYIQDNLLGEDGVFANLRSAMESLADEDVLGGIEDIGNALSSAFDFNWQFGFQEDPDNALKTLLEDDLGLSDPEQNWIENGLRSSVGWAVWTGTGSLGLAVLSATIGFDWGVRVVGDALSEEVDAIEEEFESDKENFIKLATGEYNLIEYIQAQWGETTGNVEERSPSWLLKFEEEGLEDVQDAWEWWNKNVGERVAGFGEDVTQTRAFQLLFDLGGAWEAVKTMAEWWEDHTGQLIVDWFSGEDLDRGFQMDYTLLSEEDWNTVKDAWAWWNENTGKPLLEWYGGSNLKRVFEIAFDISGAWEAVKEAWEWWNEHTGKPLLDWFQGSDLSRSFSFDVDWPELPPWLEWLWQNAKGAFRTAVTSAWGNGDEPEGRRQGGPIGFIPGYGGGDQVPAMLERGEFVWPKEMVKKYSGIIKGMWKGFRSGGPVGMQEGGSVGRSPGRGSDEEDNYPMLERVLGPLEQMRSAMEPHVGDVERLNEIFGTLETVLTDVIKGYEGSKKQIQELVNEQKELEKQYKEQIGVSEDFLDNLEENYEALEGKEEINKFYESLRDAALGQKEYIDNLKTLGLGTEEAQAKLDKLREKATRLGVDWEGLIGESQGTESALSVFADQLGVSADQLRSTATTTMNSLQELATATGELGQAEESRISGWTGAAQSALQGDWFGAAMDLFTGYMKGYIEELKKKRRELEAKIDTAHDIAIKGITEMGQALSGLTQSYLGPFGATVNGITGSLGSFAEMTLAFTQGNTLDMVRAGFEGIMSISTGLISTFEQLIKNTKAHNALQERLEPLWDLLGEAVSQLIWPLTALADWALDYLGIVRDVKDDMADIAEMNVPAGLKRARASWEATAAGELPGGGGEAETAIPEWARQVIEPLKANLRPILDSIKSQGGLFKIIKEKVVQLWQNWAPAIAQKIPGFLEWIGQAASWLKENIPWESIAEGIVAMAKFFIENFPDALEAFGEKFDSLLNGVYGEGNMLDQLEALNDNLKTLAEVLGAGTKVIAGMAGGAAVGAAIGSVIPGVGTVLGGLVGGGLGALGGMLFQEGGIATGPTPGIFGEAGPEAVVPLDRLPQVMNMAYATPGVGGNQALNLSVTIRNLFDGKTMNNRLGDAKREINYKSTGDTGGYAQHGRNQR